MKGMILKDLLVLKTSLRTVVAFILLFGIIGISTDSGYMITFAGVYASILPMTSMAYDERSGFNRFANVLPINKNAIVYSKYIVGLMLAFAAAVVSLIIMLIGKGSDGIAEVIASCIAVPMFYQSVLMPAMFKFGVEKSRLIVLGAFVLPTMILAMVFNGGSGEAVLMALNSISPQIAMLFGFIILMIIYALSIALSVKICKKKEW